MSVFETPVEAYAQLEITLRKYSDRDIDFADAALVWLANETGARSNILQFGTLREQKLPNKSEQKQHRQDCHAQSDKG